MWANRSSSGFRECEISLFNNRGGSDQSDGILCLDALVAPAGRSEKGSGDREWTMKVSRKTGSAIALGAAAVTAVWAYRDYRKWRALGPGGLPDNFQGWMTTTWMRTRKRDPIDTGRFTKLMATFGDRSFLDDLPQREGARPAMAVYPVPHRQLDQIPGSEMKQKVGEIFNDLVSRRSDRVQYQLSFFEKRHQAVFLRQPGSGHAQAQNSKGEIAHIHPSDGSMHMIFSPTDARKIIQAGWGECHPLAGVLLGLPDTYLLIYPPRNEFELAVTARLLDAAVDHLSGAAST